MIISHKYVLDLDWYGEKKLKIKCGTNIIITTIHIYVRFASIFNSLHTKEQLNMLKINAIPFSRIKTVKIINILTQRNNKITCSFINNYRITSVCSMLLPHKFTKEIYKYLILVYTTYVCIYMCMLRYRLFKLCFI